MQVDLGWTNVVDFLYKTYLRRGLYHLGALTKLQTDLLSKFLADVLHLVGGDGQCVAILQEQP